MSVTLKAAACSNKGCVRQNNEDNFCLNGYYMQREQRDAGGLFKCSTQPTAIFAVCDGMGGEEAGEEASLLSVQLCAKALKDQVDLSDQQTMRNFLHDGCKQVYEQAKRQHNRSGATMSLVFAKQDAMYFANMGDSRIYVMRKSGLKQISRDHTEMQRLLDAKEITRDQIKTHPKRHMILQYWGMPLDVAPFTPALGKRAYTNGERYLLCSDGLTDMLTDEQIEQIMGQNKPVGALCEELVAQALKHGGRDNVTVIVVETEVTESNSSPKPAPKAQDQTKEVKKLKTQRTVLRAMLGVLCAADLLVAYQWIRLLL